MLLRLCKGKVKIPYDHALLLSEGKSKQWNGMIHLMAFNVQHKFPKYLQCALYCLIQPTFLKYISA